MQPVGVFIFCPQGTCVQGGLSGPPPILCLYQPLLLYGHHFLPLLSPGWVLIFALNKRCLRGHTCSQNILGIFPDDSHSSYLLARALYLATSSFQSYQAAGCREQEVINKTARMPSHIYHLSRGVAWIEQISSLTLTSPSAFSPAPVLSFHLFSRQLAWRRGMCVSIPQSLDYRRRTTGLPLMVKPWFLKLLIHRVQDCVLVVSVSREIETRELFQPINSRPACATQWSLTSKRKHGMGKWLKR